MHPKFKSILLGILDAILAGGATYLAQWLGVLGLGADETLAVATTLFVVLKAIRKFFEGPAPSPEPLPEPKFRLIAAVQNSGVTDDPVIADGLAKIDDQFAAIEGKRLVYFDPTWFVFLAEVLLKLVAQCRKEPADLHATIRAARWPWAFRKREQLKQAIRSALATTSGRKIHGAELASAASAVYGAASQASQTEFVRFVTRLQERQQEVA